MKLTYRPEIDGLRSIAVGAVILYHAQIIIFGHQLFKGGFIGVDIFFVISGYLITSIILKELYSTGSFSFKYFYERRIRRILPALLFVIMVSLPFAWIYLLPTSFIDYSSSILYSLGFSSNFYFHYSGQQYGADSGLLKPFLHTWSLSIEEQFYLIFPLILLILFKYFRKYLIQILTIGFILSLVLADQISRNYPSTSFYFLHTRMWELLAGSILSYFEIKKGHRSKNKLFNSILPIFGLLLIGHSFLFFDDKILHPSFLTLSPIIGTCLILWFCHKDDLISKILSTKLFVGIGLISYSLYLWHYPIFAFERITEFSNNNFLKQLSLGLIIFFLSIFTYYFIERNFRNKKFKFKKIILILTGLLLVLITFNLYIISEDGVKTRLPKILQVKLRANDINFHQNNNLQKIVLIGDSHKQTLEFHLNEKVKKNNLSLFEFDTPFYLKDFNFVDRYLKKIDKKFIKNNNQINNFLEENQNLIVILHHRWAVYISETYYENEEGYKEINNLIFSNYLQPINIKKSTLQERQKYIKDSLISQINNIVEKGHKLILVYPVPEMGFSVPKYLLKEIIREKNKKEQFIPILSESYDAYKKRNKLVFEILESVQNPNIYRVYPHKIFCDIKIKNRCVANDKNNLFYYDDNHLSLKGSEFVVEEIMKYIKIIEFTSN